MDHYIKIFKCLADRTRIRILRLLSEAEHELCVCEIVDSLDVPVYNISKHIRELKNCGLLTESRKGTFVMYSLSHKTERIVSEIIKLVKMIPEEEFKNDFQRMTERLSIREDGKCVIGFTNNR